MHPGWDQCRRRQSRSRSLFVLPRSIQRVASSDRLSSGTTSRTCVWLSRGNEFRSMKQGVHILWSATSHRRLKKFLWLLVNNLMLLSSASVGITLPLRSGSMIVCLPAALCLLRFVTCILSLIDVKLTKFFFLGSAKEPNRWNPATPRAILRNAHIREMWYKKHARRLLARCLRQIHKSHGPCVAWLFKPVVYPSICKALVMLRFLSWSCYLVIACSSTCVLF